MKPTVLKVICVTCYVLAVLLLLATGALVLVGIWTIDNYDQARVYSTAWLTAIGFLFAGFIAGGITPDAFPRK